MLFIPLVQGQKGAEAGSRYFQNSFSCAFGRPKAHENGFYWERGRLARRIWLIPTASRNRRAFAAFVVLVSIARLLNTTAGEDARAPSVHLFSEQLLIGLQQTSRAWKL
jgi:hypothetical protein